jgi:hypothetical protein
VSTLIVEELETGSTLSQEITLEIQERVLIGSISPYLFMQNAPAGTFTFTLTKSGTTVFSKTFTSADIKTALNTSHNYAHVFYPIVPTSPTMIEKGVYSMSLSASGYTFLESSYLGWCRQFEDLNNEVSYNAPFVWNNPLAYRMKTYKQGVTID